MQGLWQLKVILYTRNLGYGTGQARFLQGDGVNLPLAGSLPPSMISLIHKTFSFPLAAVCWKDATEQEAESSTTQSSPS